MAAATRTLFHTDSFRIGAFCCTPGDPRWTILNRIPSAPHVVFPQTSVVIGQVGREPVLANPNHVMFYNADQPYRRWLHDKRGDCCVFIAVRPARFGEILKAAAPPNRRSSEATVPFDHGPSDAAVYLQSHLLARHLMNGEQPDRLFVEETAYHVLTRALAHAYALNRRAEGRRRPRTRAAHRRLVEDAKALLSATTTERLTLAELARTLHSSEFHLARTFRAATGFTLHTYRNHLRLRLALERLPDAHVDLAKLALDLGYCSHSHFGDSFRAVFGVPPSQLRGVLGRRGVRELRSRLEAQLDEASGLSS